MGRVLTDFKTRARMMSIVAAIATYPVTTALLANMTVLEPALCVVRPQKLSMLVACAVATARFVRAAKCLVPATTMRWQIPTMQICVFSPALLKIVPEIAWLSLTARESAMDPLTSMHVVYAVVTTQRAQDARLTQQPATTMIQILLRSKYVSFPKAKITIASASVSVNMTAVGCAVETDHLVHVQRRHKQQQQLRSRREQRLSYLAQQELTLSAPHVTDIAVAGRLLAATVRVHAKTSVTVARIIIVCAF